MKKIAIFVEGQSEQIFVRDLLLKVFDNSKLSFHCVKLYADEMQKAPYHYNIGQPHVKVHFLVIDASNDKKVLSAIQEREKHLFKKGYDKVLGLRDMYSEEYRKRSTIINDKVIKNFINGAMKTISLMSCPEKTYLYYAIMELEAWFLGMYNLFCKIDNTLNIDYIKDKMGYNLNEINPQNEFYKPSDELDKIFKLVELQYKKRSNEVNKISSYIEKKDCENAIENNRCDSFKCFYKKILSFSESI